MPEVEVLATRERILATCLRLFNESGPDAVTTARIAATVGINEGNLYYYFRKKEDILVALFAQFEAALERVAGAREPACATRDPRMDYLRCWFDLMWEWRFFYRDTATIKRLAPKLRQQSMALAAHAQADIRRVLQQMADEGLLCATPEEMDRLLVNAWIVGAYWLDYLASRHGIDKVTQEHLDWGFAQVQSLFAPYTPQPPLHTKRRKGKGT